MTNLKIAPGSYFFREYNGKIDFKREVLYPEPKQYNEKIISWMPLEVTGLTEYDKRLIATCAINEWRDTLNWCTYHAKNLIEVERHYNYNLMNEAKEQIKLWSKWGGLT